MKSITIQAVGLLFVFGYSYGAVTFFVGYKYPRIAVNYSIPVTFHIDAPGFAGIEPVCGFVNGDGQTSCRTYDDSNKKIESFPLGDSGYTFVLLNPAKFLGKKLYGNPTYETEIILRSPVSVVSLPTTPAVPFPPVAQQTTVPNIAEDNSAISFPEDIISLSIFCCLRDKTDQAIDYSEITLWIKPVKTEHSNWTDGSKESTFRRFASSAQVDRSSCECDLRSGFCDSLCCCDPECSDEEKLAFKCNQRIYPYPVVPSPPFKCSDLMVDSSYYVHASLFNPFPHAWFCIMFENSAHLGNHYNDLDYGDVKDRAYLNHRTVYLPGHEIYSAQKLISNGYKQNLPLMSINPNASKEGSAQKFKTLRPNMFFPGKGPDGRCLRNIPIRFLKDSDVTCALENLNSNTQCEKLLDPSSYIPPEDSIVARINGFQDYTLLPRIPCSCTKETANTAITACKVDELKQCTGRLQAVSLSPSDCQCYTKSKVVSQGNSWYCSNALEAVELTLGWSGNGTDIGTSSVKIKLLDRVNRGETIQQKFSVKFRAVKKEAKEKDMNGEHWKWYRHGDEVNYQSRNAASQSLNTCSCLSTQPIIFGVNSLNSCEIETAFQDFENCDELRGVTINSLLKMIPAEKISRFAIPTESETASQDEWIDVRNLRRIPPIFPKCGQPSTSAQTNSAVLESSNKISNQRLGRFPAFYNSIDEESRLMLMGRNGTSDIEISAANLCGPQRPSRIPLFPISNENQVRTASIKWPMACGTKRICERIPNSIQLSILRRVTGAINGTLQHEIIGASISFSTEDWLIGSALSLKKYLKASIKFVDVSNEEEEASYVNRLVSMSKDWDILYPITGVIYSEQSYSISAAAGLGLLLIAALIIAPPK